MDLLDPVLFDHVTKGGALCVLLYLIPLLRSIAASLAAIAILGPSVIEGLRDAGVPLDGPPATVRGATRSLVAHLRGVAPALVALMLAGCSCASSIAEGMNDLRRDFELYRRASVAAPGADQGARAELEAAITDHIDNANKRAE